MLNLNIDPKSKSINIEVLLKGEDKPLEVSVNDYKLTSKDKSFIKIGEVETSKPWLNIILDEFVVGGEVKLPPKVAKLLKIVM